MMGGGGSESLAFNLALFGAVTSIVWVPIWLVALVEWWRKRRNDQPASRLLRATVAFPLAFGVLTLVTWSLNRVEDAGLRRRSAAYAESIGDRLDAAALQYEHSNRFQRCGSTSIRVASEVELDAGSSRRAGAAADLLRDLGWSVPPPARQLEEAGDVPTVVGRRDRGFTQVRYRILDGGSANVWVEACPSTSEGSVGYDSRYVGAALAWACGLGIARWIWQRRHGSPEPRVRSPETPVLLVRGVLLGASGGLLVGSIVWEWIVFGPPRLLSIVPRLVAAIALALRAIVSENP